MDSRRMPRIGGNFNMCGVEVWGAAALRASG
jgi:hypothetical protein